MFYNYRNIPINYVMIHKAECRFCNNGQGVQNVILGGANGEWNGPYNTFRIAHQNAVATGFEVRLCGRCNPNN